ncbi:MAG: phosphoglucomutase/phosphomannomutase family protein [Chloroflexi bacterium]|nr:phosphoglucomutase/phosphomannomutase family protein [Chloroflexota bacterium]
MVEGVFHHPVKPIKFGTDGWRAIIARDFTFENVRACALGVARYLERRGMASRGLVVGYDTRFASEEFAAEVASVVAASGTRVLLCSRAAPTPVVSFNVVHRRAAGAVVITASHNPWAWNGFKYKSPEGGSAAPEVVAELEGEIARVLAGATPQLVPLPEARSRGLLDDLDPAPPYLAHAATLVDLGQLRAAGLKVGVDAMHGAGAGYFPALLGGGATTFQEIRGERNPLFPGMAQPEPIAANLGPLADAVRRDGLDVGVALDGDADRLGLVDERGQFITTLQTFALLCLYWLEVRGQRGPLVKSLTQTGMIERLGQLYDVPVHMTPVGFKYLGPVMVRENALAAGEESGGYAFRGNIPERDGIFGGLLFLDMMVRTGKRPSELLEWLYSKVGPHHFDRWDLEFPPQQREAIQRRTSKARPDRLAGKRVESIDTQDGYRFNLEGGYWALVRFSGTEPLLRLYAEAESPEQVRELLGALREMAGV